MRMQVYKLLFVFCCCVYGARRMVKKRTDSSEEREREECMAVMENRWEPKDGQEMEDDYSHIHTIDLLSSLIHGRPLPPPPPKLPADGNICSVLFYPLKYFFWYITVYLWRASR